MICRFVIPALFLGCLTFASASPLDFKTNVLDPPQTSFSTFATQSLTFPITFTACQAGELPGNNEGDGCFAGTNVSGRDWTSIQFKFANTPALHGQPASCNTAPTDSIFGTAACGLQPSQAAYVLTFSNGVLPNGAIFFVTEEGVPAEDFPSGTLTVLTSRAATPEPGSLLLLSTGVFAAGLLVKTRYC